MSEAKSDSPLKCGLCGGKAYIPVRMVDENPAVLDGLFNVCGDCGAECSGTGSYSETDRWYWTGARQVAQGRAALEAALLDAEWAEDRRHGDW